MNNITKTRYAGVLMHISSLPSPYGIGTLGLEAYEFADFLAKSHVRVWQMLPLNVTSYGDSPYQSPSSTGLNYYFIDLPTLRKKGLLSREEYENVDFGSDPKKVNYGKLFENRIRILKLAFSRFNREDSSFCAFEQKGAYRDFAFFMTLKERNRYQAWYTWNEEYRNYSPELEERILSEDRDTYLFYIWTQFEFLDEFNKLKDYCHQKGISIMGDMPLYLAYDSVEAYKYADLFLFDEKHNPTVVAGVPPDYFSKDGQLWGNPIYNWAKMKEDHYAWFSDRIKNNLALFDILRIDHFRGFADYYTIPFGMQNARIGNWVLGPGMDLFEDKLDLPIIAEDLGDIDDVVVKLLKDTGYPGMKILEFAFDGAENNPHKPHNCTENYVTYTGTHDNMPILGYLKQLTPEKREVFLADLKKECELCGIECHIDTLEEATKTLDVLALSSQTNGAILPLQDLLCLDENSRMNEPSTLTDRNWTYRCRRSDLSPELASFLGENILRFHRT